MIEDVAVELPVTRVVGHKRELSVLPRPDQNCVAPFAPRRQYSLWIILVGARFWRAAKLSELLVRPPGEPEILMDPSL